MSTEASQQANRAEMDPRRLVVISYLVFALVLSLFFAHVIGLVMAQLGVTNTQVIDAGPTVADLVGFLLAAGLAVYAWVAPRIKGLALEVATELMRVTWPSWEETRVSTMAVVVASLVAAIILFGIDTLSYKVMVEWLPVVWRAL